MGEQVIALATNWGQFPEKIKASQYSIRY